MAGKETLRELGSQISVCLLTYNHVDVIESTLQTILKQTLTGYEVIVSDDCSTDGTWERVCAMAEENPGIRTIRTPRNLGMPGNANFAVPHSTRPYIALLHHDDLYRADLLERWVGVMVRHEDVGFVFNPYGIPDSDLVHKHPLHPFAGERLDGLRFLETVLLPHWGCYVRGTAMIRRRWWVALAGMRERFGPLADVDFWMRLAAVTAVGYVSEPVITTRHARPSYYPDIYQAKGWSWIRQRYLYEIHAANWQAYCATRGFSGHIKWWLFRFRLSVETAKWLAYAAVRKRFEMIAESGESNTPYDQWWLRVFRAGLVLVCSGIRTKKIP